MDRPEEPIRCSECKREPGEDENPDDEWRAVSDGVGELHIFRPECWELEFSEDAPASGLWPLVWRGDGSGKPRSAR